MAISISTNTSAMQIIQALSSASRLQNRSLLRLATTLRINSPADDPPGSFLASRFRNQLATLGQASENTQLASSQLSTADTTLEQIGSLLDTISASITAVLGGGASVADEQATVDNAIQSINRLTLSSRFGDTYLLNNTAAIPVTAKSAALTDVNPRRVEFGSGTTATFNVNVTTIGAQGTLDVANAGEAAAAGAGSVTVRLTGPKGTADITLNSGDTGVQLEAAVDAVRAQTGVFYDAGFLYSEDFGTDATISTERVGGTANYMRAAVNLNAFQSNTGVNAAGTVNGAAFGANGNQITASSATFNLAFSLRPGNPIGAYSITVAKGGLTYQLGTQALPSDRLTLGLNTTMASALGFTAETLGGLTVGGFLSSVGGGGANDLSTNPSNASSINAAAQTQVASLRSFLGSIISTSLDPNIAAIEDTTTEVTGALGIVQDADVATEAMNLALAQARVSSSTSSLIIANDFPRNLASRLLQALEPD